MFTTAEPNEAVAFLFVANNVVAVVFDANFPDRATLKLAHELRSMRPHVPILLLRRAPLEPMPTWLGVCVMTSDDAAGLTSVLRSVVNGEIACSSDPVSKSLKSPVEPMLRSKRTLREGLITSLSSLLHLWRT
jgi:hypothetical protein